MKKVINYGSHTISKADIRAVNNVLKNQYISQGPANIEFEKKLSSYFGSKFCSVVSSGTAALHLISLALKWNKNDEIITTPLTFVATSNSIIYSGARPRFVDIDFNTYNIDINKLEDQLKKKK